MKMTSEEGGGGAGPLTLSPPLSLHLLQVFDCRLSALRSSFRANLRFCGGKISGRNVHDVALLKFQTQFLFLSCPSLGKSFRGGGKLHLYERASIKVK